MTMAHVSCDASLCCGMPARHAQAAVDRTLHATATFSARQCPTPAPAPHAHAQRVKREMTPAAFELNTKMVLANPDVYHMWNFRREMIKTLFAAE